MTVVRRAVLAIFLCAAPLLAAPAQASTGMLERESVREALRHSAQAASSGVIPLPLPEPVRASAASSSSELARVARSTGPERVLVGARTHADLDGLAAELRRLGAEPELFRTIGALAATVPSGAEAVAALRDDPRVAYIERDRTLRIAADPFDILDPTSGPPPIKFTWAYDTVRAGEALATIGGGSARTVSVIDTGLDVNHPEFAGQVERVFDTSSGGADVTDIVGHGTFVSGLIAAIDGNGRGGKGVAGTTKLVAVRASLDGSFTVSDLISGIEFSIRRGVDVINLSLAGQGFTQTQARAFEAAFFNDVLPVAAAGNNAENGNPVEFPAAAIGGRQGGRGIGLSVAATKPDGGVASFSNHNDFVSLAAPGASGGSCEFGVFSTLPGQHGHRVGQAGQLLARLQRRERPLRLRRGHELRLTDHCRACRARMAGREPARLRAGGRGDGALRHGQRLERVHGRGRRGRQGSGRHRGDVRRRQPARSRQDPPAWEHREGHGRAHAGSRRRGRRAGRLGDLRAAAVA